MKISRSDIIPRQSGKTTTVYSYPSEDGILDVAYITVHGRHPEDSTNWYINHICSMICYIVKGTGKFGIEDIEIPVVKNDVVTIPKEKLYFIEGNLEYVVTSSPAYSREQAEKVVK